MSFELALVMSRCLCLAFRCHHCCHLQDASAVVLGQTYKADEAQASRALLGGSWTGQRFSCIGVQQVGFLHVMHARKTSGLGRSWMMLVRHDQHALSSGLASGLAVTDSIVFRC